MSDELNENDPPSFGEFSESEGGFQARTEKASSQGRSFGHLWLVSYSDFMTIMMIFFLGMYGYTVMAKAALIKKQQMTYSEFAEAVSRVKGPLGESVEVKEGIGKVVIQMPDKILFPSGQSQLARNAKRTLEEVANSLKLVDGEVIVEGHTDNIPIRSGRYQSNWELSAARALGVIEALTQAGVPQQRLAAWGFGDNRPIAPNLTEKDRAKNRRIEIVLLKKHTNNK